MNIRIYILVLLFIGSFCSLKAQSDSLYHHCLFPESSFTIGGSAIYGFDFDGIGINARVYYNIDERICFGPEFSYLTSSDKSLYDVNLIAHYIFDVKGIGIYPVGGLNYSKENKTTVLHGTESEEAWGIVTGAGVHRNFKRITVFAEYSHHFSTIPDDFLNLGFLLMFNPKQKK